MIVSLENLRQGIRWWAESKSGWGSDYINGEYYEMYSARLSGVTEVWWMATVKRLWAWRAIRGPKPPNNVKEITERGIARLDRIALECAKLAGKSGAEPTFMDSTWEDISALFQCALEIKPRSQVFASKMCHFLFPNLFMVMDREATGILDYEFYWRGMQSEWSRFAEKDEALGLLREAIKSDKEVHELYPFETKILELSHIGYEHRAKS